MKTSRFSSFLPATFLALGLSGCGLVKINPPSSASGPGSREAVSSAERPEVQQKREKARAWFSRCSAEYDAFLAVWKPLDDEAKKVIAEQRGKSFYDAYPLLAGQYKKTRADAKRLLGKHTPPSTYGHTRGTGIELLLTIAELQITSGYTQGLALDPRSDQLRNAYPMTGDDAFDRATFCSYATYAGTKGEGGGKGKLEAFDTSDQRYPAPWMTGEEKLAWDARVNELLKKTTDTLDELARKKAAHGAMSGDYGVIKKVKTSSDGSTLVEARAIDSPYSCQHTGSYRWNGVELTDCTYVDLGPVEMYSFTATIKELPRCGLQVGDKINVLGKDAKGYVKGKDGAAWEDVMLRLVYRGRKPLLTGIDRELDSSYYD